VLRRVDSPYPANNTLFLPELEPDDCSLTPCLKTGACARLAMVMAFGNHMATFIVALVLLAAIVFLFRTQGMVRGGIFAATAGCVVTIVIELIRLLPIR